MIAALIISQAAVAVLPYPRMEQCVKAPIKDPACIVETWTPEMLGSINQAISEAITTVEDSNPYDPWIAFPRNPDGTITGDCDDDAATKRQYLLAAGVDPKAMHYEIGNVREPDGRIVGHVVLVVQLPDGKSYVMDRKVPQGVYLAGKRPYDWTPVAVEVPGQLLWASR